MNRLAQKTAVHSDILDATEPSSSSPSHTLSSVAGESAGADCNVILVPDNEDNMKKTSESSSLEPVHVTITKNSSAT